VFTTAARRPAGFFLPYRAGFRSHTSVWLRKISLSDGKIPAHPASSGYEYKFLLPSRRAGSDMFHVLRLPPFMAAGKTA
jgi:hypothetical protein